MTTDAFYQCADRDSNSAKETDVSPFNSIHCIGMKARITVTGMVMIGTIALRKSHRKS